MYRSYSAALSAVRGTSSVQSPRKFEFDVWSRPNWDQYFMGLAYMAALRIDDPCTQVGACIVNDKKRVVGIGYNAMPHECDSGDLPWTGNMEGEDDPNWTNTKYPYVIHAVPMAVLNKNTADVEGCTLYTTMFPDSDCARIIIQSRIHRVVYWSDDIPTDIRTEVAKTMFRKIMDSDAQRTDQSQLRTVNNRCFELTEYASTVDDIAIQFHVLDLDIAVFSDKHIRLRKRNTSQARPSLQTHGPRL
jgi:dCMP deaminase